VHEDIDYTCPSCIGNISFSHNGGRANSVSTSSNHIDRILRLVSRNVCVIVCDCKFGFTADIVSGQTYRTGIRTNGDGLIAHTMSRS